VISVAIKPLALMLKLAFTAVHPKAERMVMLQDINASLVLLY